MKRRVLTLVLIGLLIINVLPFIERADASYGFAKSSGSTSLSPTIGGASQPALGNVTRVSQKESMNPAQQKLSSDLVQRETQATTSGTFTRMAKTAKTSEDLAYVYVFMIPSASTHTIDSHVSSVTDRDEQNHVAVAWVNVNDLEELASLPEVRQIQTVTPPQVNSGSVTAQSDAILHTADLRSTYGYDGTGIKVGIISDGVDHIATAQASGDLPTTASGKIHVLSNTIGGDEGTAMLEIVHDMAPGAELYFHDRGSNALAFNSAIDDLRAAGCTIICDDITWHSQPYFEDGIIATHIRDLLASQNVIYVTSAGNYARSHYQGTFYNAGSNWHDFSSGASSDKYLYVNIPSGGEVSIFLQWNDQSGHSANDYDLFLYEYPSFTLVDYSENVQSGSQNPYEYIYYTNPSGSAKDYAIVVNKYSGNSKILEVYILNSNVYTNNLHPEDSISGHAAVADVITIGAIDAADPGNDEIEPFSSRGPVTISYPSAQSRQKPDLAGIDGVSVTGAGGFSNPFFGTSAAAPTVAAVAADIWSEVPGKSALEVRNRLYSTAIDLGTPGKDTIFGNGRVDALQAFFMGTISVSSTPSGANTYLDGVYRGITPITMAGITPGDHTIKLNKTNYSNVTFTVTVVGGQTTTVSRTLVPTDTLSVSSTPSGANTYFDGVYKGITPITLGGITLGDHTIKLNKTYYRDDTFIVTAIAGQTTTVSRTLDPTATLSVSSTPSGANTYFDGVYRGITPITMAGITPGNYTIKLNKTNYYDDIFTVNAVGVQTTSVTRKLIPTTEGNVTVEGDVIGPVFSVDISTPSAGWGMAYGDNSWFSPAGTSPLPSTPPGGGLTITAHAQKDVAFSVSVSDKLDWGKPLATKGKMAEYRASGWVTSGKVLTNPLRLNESTGGTFKEWILTATTDPVLFTGVGDLPPGGGGIGLSHSFDVRQQVTLADVPVVSGSVYKLPLTFTLTAL